MSCVIAFADTKAELLGAGLVWFPAYRLLCGSDIHLEKGTFFQRFSTLLPPYDTHATLIRLAEAFAQYKPELFVSLGDAFHDVNAVQRMRAEDRQLLDTLISSVRQFVWVEGNHDPHMPADVGGIRRDIYTIHAITFRHDAKADAQGWEISGHYHPKALVSLRGHSLRLPCFITSHQRLLMPAFGSYTGGLDVRHEAISSIWPMETRILYLLHGGQVFTWRETIHER